MVRSIGAFLGVVSLVVFAVVVVAHLAGRSYVGDSSLKSLSSALPCVQARQYRRRFFMGFFSQAFGYNVEAYAINLYVLCQWFDGYFHWHVLMKRSICSFMIIIADRLGCFGPFFPTGVFDRRRRWFEMVTKGDRLDWFMYWPISLSIDCISSISFIHLSCIYHFYYLSLYILSSYVVCDQWSLNKSSVHKLLYFRSSYQPFASLTFKSRMKEDIFKI